AGARAHGKQQECGRESPSPESHDARRDDQTEGLVILDPSVLEGWDADDLVATLVEMFAEDAPRLAHEIAVSDAKARTRAAHSLRGCALNLGAADLARAAGAIERGDVSAVSSVEALTAQTIRVLRDHCSVKQRAPLAVTEIR